MVSFHAIDKYRQNSFGNISGKGLQRVSFCQNQLAGLLFLLQKSSLGNYMHWETRNMYVKTISKFYGSLLKGLNICILQISNTVSIIVMHTTDYASPNGFATWRLGKPNFCFFGIFWHCLANFFGPFLSSHNL